MRVAYVSVATPSSRRSWSGIPWYSLRALRERFPDTHVIDTPRLDRAIETLAAAERFRVNVRRNPLVSQLYRRAINAALEQIQPDVVVGVAAAHKLALIDPKWPMVYASDALFGTVVDYYLKYHSYTERTRRQGNKLQRELLKRTDRVLLASSWAAQDAMERYDLPHEKVRVVPMGANIDSVPTFAEPPLDGPLRLIFVGYAWERKGGPLVLDIWRELHGRTDGNVELHIIGSRPKAALGLENVIVHGAIDKTDPAAYRTFIDLYQNAHFLLMPSRQEAYGIVYCEAAAFGRPSIGTETGGVPTIVRDNETGLILPFDASPKAYADRILALWSDPGRYRAMCHAARKDFEERLNWTQWGQSVETAINEAVSGH
ncbi:glycosyltransferase family 4 protein [Novosphingobium mangrovi (ex Huang et al. 2023)]|uniref:Glycosyltransferase family 4 protein n=1 Tax=Novosphingobium mangrovi (ex Huang et al. 2023) TaxID=2976432 RepID=A0ABT2I0U3_9SPHN|nr:glycosyltransferase family 4 protein [Novosphingobium mangrovi (ex Huang et al. 2023)]MCT2398421.1 glycosyltransferase family 4 protein [Novosphingobium mangrovi (ex Huang et al. 2023)]